MDITETKMNFSTLATWLPTHGSLQNTLIFSTESPAEDQEFDSCPLLLTPLQESSSPCEITLKFEGSSCEVSSVYVRSTARIFELYSQSEISSDNEYICTARGELAMQNDDPTDVGETINKIDSSSFGRDNSADNISGTSLHSLIENGTEPFLNVDNCDKESHNYPSQPGSIDGNADETSQVLHESIRVSEEIGKRESQSSDEDSWVEVGLSGSLVVDSLGKPGEMCHLQSKGYIDYSEDKAAQKSDVLAEHACKDPLDSCTESGQHNDKSSEDVPFLYHAKEENLSNIGVSNPLIATNMGIKARANENIVSSSTSKVSKAALYEATVEIVNAKPCVSLTIRLLSLQDKSFVEIDTIYICGLRASDVKDAAETFSLGTSSLPGSPFGGSLLAMLLPSMLQMSRGGLTQYQNDLSNNVQRDKRMPQMESSETELSRSSHSSFVSSPIPVKDIETSTGDKLSSETVPGKEVSPDQSLLQEKHFPHLDKVGENNEQLKNNLKSTLQNSLPCIGTTDDIKGRQKVLGGENSFMGVMAGTNESISILMDGPDNEESNRHYISEELESHKTDKSLFRENNEENMLEHICKRMDRLEVVCLRIEDYVHRSFEKLERRLQFVESCQMQQNHSLVTKIESNNVCLDFPVVPNTYSENSISGLDTSNNGIWKHIAEVDTRNLLNAKVPSICKPRACSASSPELSPSFAIESPRTFPLDASCVDNSKELHSENTDLLRCNKETSNATLDTSPKLELDYSGSRSLDRQDLSKEEHLGDKDSQSAESIGVCGGSEVSSNAINEHQITPNKTKLCLEEVLASQLSAFSVSARPVQVETRLVLTEIPPDSSQIENADDKEGSDHEGLSSFHSSQVEITGLCPGVPCHSSEVDNSDEEEACYNDNTLLNAVEEVRYISQENIYSVPYCSSHRNEDARQTVYRGRNISDVQGSLALTVKQSCKPGTKIVSDHEKKIELLEDENEQKLNVSEIKSAENVFGPIHVNQTTSTNMVHDCLGKLHQLHGYNEFEPLRLCPKPPKIIIEKDKNVDEEKYASFNHLSGNNESHVAEVERMIRNLEEKQGEVSSGLESPTEAPDKFDSRQLNIDASSLLDVSFTISDTSQIKMSLESLLGDNAPEHGGETAPLQQTIEAEASDFSESKRPHGLFFVEDEGLGEFIISGTSTFLCSVTTGNTSNEGIVSGISPVFESLL